MAHKFTVGQTVDLPSNKLRAAGRYQIRQLVPASDSAPEDPGYRIKSDTESNEWVVRESELTLAPAQSAFRGPRRA
jgi:hypothetical protein